MRRPEPSRGDVWLVDLNPTKGHERSGVGPGLVISTDVFNHGPAGLVVLLPLTTRDRGVPLHVRIDPPEGGLRERSFVKCDDVRSVDKERLVSRWGTVSSTTVEVVEDRIRILLEL